MRALSFVTGILLASLSLVAPVAHAQEKAAKPKPVASVARGPAGVTLVGRPSAAQYSTLGLGGAEPRKATTSICIPAPGGCRTALRVDPGWAVPRDARNWPRRRLLEFRA